MPAPAFAIQRAGQQPIDGGTCTSLAFSRNPMKALDDQGNLLQWIEVGSGQSRLVYCDTSGSQRIAIRRGDTTPIEVRFVAKETSWLSANTLIVRPITGFPLAQGQRHAASWRFCISSGLMLLANPLLRRHDRFG